MSDRRQEFRVGVVALSTVVIVALLVSLNTGASLTLRGTPYVVQIRVDRAPGVGTNTPVRKDGVLIGRVIETTFVPGGGVLVTANIQPGSPIYQTDACRIQPSSLFGDAVINFVYTGDTTEPILIEDGQQISGRALPDPIEALTSLQVDIGPAINSIGEAADGVARLTQRVDEALSTDIGEGQVNSLIGEARLTMEQFREMMQRVIRLADDIDEVFDGPALKQSLAKVTEELPMLLSDARGTVRQAAETLDSFGSVIHGAEENLENLKGFTGPLGERGPELAGMLTKSIENLSLSLGDIAQFASALTDSNGTISRLVSDPALYDNLTTVVGNANVVLVQVNEFVRTLRPVVADARVFMDKVAREPGRLVGGALNRGPGLK